MARERRLWWREYTMGPKPAGLDGPPRHEPPQALEASMVPHRGFIVVDVLPSGTIWITPLAARERKELPRLSRGVVWEFSFDDDGFAVSQAVMEGGEAEAVAAEDVLSLRWFKSSDGASFTRSACGPTAGPFVNLNEFQNKPFHSEMKLKLGDAQ